MTTAAPGPAAHGPTVDVRLSYGPLLIGVFFNMILYGKTQVLIAQQLSFFKTTRRNPLWVTALVWGVFFVETANTAFDMAFVYQPLILEYGAVPDLFPTLFLTQPLCVIAIVFPIQLFFLWRVRTLTRLTFLPGLVLLVACTAFGGGVWTTVLVPVVAHFTGFPRLYRSAGVWLIASAAADLSIAALLAAALRSKKTGSPVTDSVLDRIIRMTVQTGLITAVFSILDVVCFLALRGDTVNFIWNIPLSKLYSNCLLSTLNAREGLMADFVAAHADLLVSESGPTFASAVSFESADDKLERGPEEYGETPTTTVAECV
ncbi:hypothetical protein GGX14DRAFT_658355 [Mycena pura]|uniref:DUF6534 domain-containing protein n=1 Tax=Mycena pura TaxID=153505 RepID=A0AAD7E1H5_9AGAR|nr:hypothetical protein GGX14DRAFT_658355 [Mycena pura]